MPVIQSQGARFNGTQCQGAYAFEKFISQELSSRVGKNTEFIFLQLEGENTAQTKNSPFDTVNAQNSPLDTAQTKNSPLDTVHP
jgi:hypothetical protein